MKLTKKTIRLILLGLAAAIIIWLFLPEAASYAEYQIPSQYKPEYAPDIGARDYNVSTISIFLQFLAGNVLWFSGAIAVALLVWAGMLYVTAMGQQEQMEKAKKTIIWTIIGLLAMIFAYVIIQFVISTFLELPSELPKANPSDVPLIPVSQ